MTYVERELLFRFPWAEPLHKGGQLEVERVGPELNIIGCFPRYQVLDPPSDPIWQYERAPKHFRIGKQRTGKQSPDILFANADTEEKLIAFTRQFGPVVAKAVSQCAEHVDTATELTAVPRLFARQDMQEFRNERLIYRAALTLVMQLAQRRFDYSAAQRLIGQIATNIRDWRRQWEREQLQRGCEPLWKLSLESLKRIESLSFARPDGFLHPTLDGRIVICGLLNSFRETVFPNPLEMHSSIRYGIRPLLYSILRRRFLYPRGFAACANTQCPNFFDVERAGQKFCCAECSRKQRQRMYWKATGKKLRKKRLQDSKPKV